MSRDRTNSEQSGFALITVVMGLLVIGLILMTGLNQLISSWHKSMLIEQRYYTRFNQAYSSLNWGYQLKWPIPSKKWQCQSESVKQYTACIKQSSLNESPYILVRGEYQHFYLYQIAMLDNNKLKFLQGHWLDYCPDNRRNYCD